MDVRTDVNTEFLPILQKFFLFWDRCPERREKKTNIWSQQFYRAFSNIGAAAQKRKEEAKKKNRERKW